MNDKMALVFTLVQKKNNTFLQPGNKAQKDPQHSTHGARQLT